MEIQHSLKNCYCFDRSFKGKAAKAEALQRFKEEERLWRDQPRAASVSLACPADTQYLWAIIVIQDWSEARILEAVDPGESADPRRGRISFEICESDPLAEWAPKTQTPPLYMPTIKKRDLIYQSIRFGDSDELFSYWVRTE